MDHIKQDLDELMGKDRNTPLHLRLQKRDHFDDEQVCKYNLLSFCPHDLFPNTKADLLPCQKRHDEFLRDMFKADPDRLTYQRKYEKELQNLLEQMIQQVDMKIKRSLARIETPVPDHLNIPEMNAYQQETAHQRIDALEQKINFYVEKAEKLGEDGKIDESEAIMKEVDKLKGEKQSLEGLSDNTLIPKDRSMKVCDVCGALQAMTDTDKRLVMHLEGKLHTGYLKIRKVLNELKAKREEYRRQDDRERKETGKRKSRSRSFGKDRQRGTQQKVEVVEEFFNYSSKKYGTGANIPYQSDIKLSVIAMMQNQNAAVPSLAKTETMAKEWGYYKRNIDKQKKEAQNEQKRKEDEAKRAARGYGGGGGYGGDRGGDRRNDNFNRGGGDREYKRR